MWFFRRSKDKPTPVGVRENTGNHQSPWRGFPATD